MGQVDKGNGVRGGGPRSQRQPNSSSSISCEACRRQSYGGEKKEGWTCQTNWVHFSGMPWAGIPINSNTYPKHRPFGLCSGLTQHQPSWICRRTASLAEKGGRIECRTAVIATVRHCVCQNGFRRRTRESNKRYFKSKKYMKAIRVRWWDLILSSNLLYWLM